MDTYISNCDWLTSFAPNFDQISTYFTQRLSKHTLTKSISMVTSPPFCLAHGLLHEHFRVLHQHEEECVDQITFESEILHIVVKQIHADRL